MPRGIREDKTAMIPKELFAKIKQIDITSTRLVESVFAGEYHSVFKGKGIEFDEVREYVPGDDIRDIDWNVTAKTGVPHTKRFVEARELTVIFLVDVSASGRFGSRGRSKSEVMAEICAILALSAVKNNDRVGLLFFTDRVEKYIPPKKGKRHVLRVVREVLSFTPKGKRTDLNAALHALNDIVQKKATVFLFSDFLTDAYEKLLKITHRKHDMVAVIVEDRRESEWPRLGLVEAEDMETGESLTFNASNPFFRKRFKKQSEERRAARTRLFDSIRMDHIDIRADESYMDPLTKFFKAREKRAQRS